MRVYLKGMTKKDYELTSGTTLNECREVVERNKQFLIGLNDNLNGTHYIITKESEDGFTYTITREVQVGTEVLVLKKPIITLEKEVVTLKVYIK